MNGGEVTRGTARLTQVLVIGAAAALLLGSAAPSWSANRDENRRATTSLHGSWVLDRAKSDDAQQILRTARDKSSQSGRWGGPGGPGGPGEGERGGIGPGGQPGTAGRGGDTQGGPGRMQGRGGPPESPELARLMRPAQELVIRGDEAALELVEDGGTPSILRIEGAGAPYGGPASVLGAARWQGRELVSVSTLRGNAKMTDTYQVSKDGACLTITSKISGGGTEFPNVKIRRVYTRVHGR